MKVISSAAFYKLTNNLQLLNSFQPFSEDISFILFKLNLSTVLFILFLQLLKHLALTITLSHTYIHFLSHFFLTICWRFLPFWTNKTPQFYTSIQLYSFPTFSEALLSSFLKRNLYLVHLYLPFLPQFTVVTLPSHLSTEFILTNVTNEWSMAKFTDQW